MTSAPANDADGSRVKRLNQHFGPLVVQFSGDKDFHRNLSKRTSGEAEFASLGGFAFGVSLAWNSLAVEVFRKNLDATATEIGLAGAILNCGASVGAILVPFGVRYLRHITLMSLTLPVLFLGWILICLSGQKVTALIIGRAFCGVSIGATCILTPTFIADIADKKKREQVLAYFQLLISCGVMYAFLLAHCINLPKTIWRYSLLCMLPCFAIQLVHLLPESPLHYLAKEDKSKATESLKWYRGAGHKIEEELGQVERLVLAIRSQKISWKLLRNGRIVRSWLSCLLVVLAQQLCGINAMIFFARPLFEIAGSGELTVSELTLVVAGVQILSCLLASVLLSVVSRRVLLAASCSLMGLFLISLGWFFHLRQMDPEYDDIYSWMPPAWISLFFAAYNIGVGPISWSMLGDSLPMEMRIETAACIVSVCWLVAFLLNLHFVEIVMAIGVPKLMCLNAGLCWVAGVCAVVLTVDNKGKSLTEIHEKLHAVPEQNVPEP